MFVEAALLAQETLRMYPPVGIGQVRISNSHDITLADRLHIPAGTCIWVPHHAIQNASFNWDDPEKFMPCMRTGFLYCARAPANQEMCIPGRYTT